VAANAMTLKLNSVAVIQRMPIYVIWKILHVAMVNVVKSQKYVVTGNANFVLMKVDLNSWRFATSYMADI
jgi:hypothetical protein